MKKYQSFLGENRMIKDQGLLRHEDIRKKIRVLPELEDLIPPLQTDEFEQLESNILKEGCREALLIWEVGQSEDPIQKGEYVLIDGHNRFRICTKHGLDFRIHLISFSGLSEVKDYMIDNQLGRRNLSPEQISYLRGKKYNAQKIDKGKYDRTDHKGQNVPYGLGTSTADRLAEQFNVSQKTIKRDAVFADGLDMLPVQQKRDILSGKVKMKKADVQALGRGEDIIAKPEQKTATLLQVDKKDRLIKKIGLLSNRLSPGSNSNSSVCDQLIIVLQELKKLG